MSTSASTSPAARPTPSEPPPHDSHDWRAVSIVLVGAFMALLDSTTLAFNTAS
jgi:hypothetical protein